VTPVLFVLAGVNGAGKSSLGGSWIRDRGLNYFNPDEASARIRQELGCSIDEANSRAWMEGLHLLDVAIRERINHAFESTLGGNTIPRLLAKAAEAGFDVHIWFVGLSTPELHLARVRARVATGGHDIPEKKVRERWETSRHNIIALLPHLEELLVFDNSEERDALTGTIPPPKLLLHWRRGAIVAPEPQSLKATPAWAKPIVAAALRLQR
jgi:predicted ABC-type ATPase